MYRRLLATFCRHTIYPEWRLLCLRSEFLNAALMQTIPDLEGTEIILETTGNPGVLLRHGVLLVFGAPCQLQSLAGQEHRPDHPLAVIAVLEFAALSRLSDYLGKPLGEWSIAVRPNELSAHRNPILRVSNQGFAPLLLSIGATSVAFVPG